MCEKVERTGMTLTEAINILGLVLKESDRLETVGSLEALEIAKDTMERVRANMVRTRMHKRKDGVK